MKYNIKDSINKELDNIKLNDNLKQKIRKNTTKENNSIIKSIAACFAVVVLTGGVVFASTFISSKIRVNKDELPELDSMQIVQIENLKEMSLDENSRINKDYTSYDEIKNELNIDLLDSTLNENNNYQLVHLTSDSNDFAMINVDNYIIGDTTKFNYIENENRYSYDNGIEYYSPISLEVDIILSNNQLENGWDTDYLGYYKFTENYVSKQGYKVNIIEDKVDKNTTNNYVSEKIAIFVSNGVRYTLKGRTSIENIKYIVDTMN